MYGSWTLLRAASMGVASNEAEEAGASSLFCVRISGGFRGGGGGKGGANAPPFGGE